MPRAVIGCDNVSGHRLAHGLPDGYARLSRKLGQSVVIGTAEENLNPTLTHGVAPGYIRTSNPTKGVARDNPRLGDSPGVPYPCPAA